MFYGFLYFVFVRFLYGRPKLLVSNEYFLYFVVDLKYMMFHINVTFTYMINLDTNKFLQNQLDKDFLAIIVNCNNAIVWAEAIKTKTRDDIYEVQKYTSYVRNIAFLLSNGIKPSSMSEFDFASTKQLLESLVAKNQLQASIISLYDSN